MPIFVKNLTAPQPPYDYEMVEFSTEVVPFALAALEERCRRYCWASDEDWRRGEQLVRQLQLGLLMGTVALEARIDRLQAMFEAAFYGRERVKVSIDPAPLQYSPPLTDEPDTTINPAVPSLLGMLDALPGIVEPGWFGGGGSKTTMADIVKGLSTGKGEAKNELWEGIDDVKDVIASGGDIGEAIGELIGGLGETVGQGGIFVAILAAAAGNMTMLHAIMIVLQRIGHVLGDTQLATLPPDTILMALRGTEPATAARNVIDAQSDNQALIDRLDALIGTATDTDVLSTLIEIRNKLA